MASAHRNRQNKNKTDMRLGWRAVFRPVNSISHAQRSRLSVPISVFEKAGLGADCGEQKAKLVANKFAQQCDNICRLIELKPTPERILLAKQLGISEQQHEKNRTPQKQLKAKRTNTTLMQAAVAHPSSKYEIDTDSKSAKTHANAVAEYCSFIGSDLLSALTVEGVLRFVAALKQRGVSFDGRRHKLLWLKRASIMAPTFGQLNVLPRGIKLDRRVVKKMTGDDVWQLAELCEAAVYFEQKKDWRRLTALALGGFCGLRNSEIVRAKWQHVNTEQRTLTIGSEKSKNANSERTLPLPQYAFDAIIKNKTQSAYLLYSHKHSSQFSHNNFGRWFAAEMKLATKKQLPTKHLRKSFATWCVAAGLNVRHVECYTGHAETQANSVLSKFYLGSATVLELRDTANRIHSCISQQIEANKNV